MIEDFLTIEAGARLADTVELVDALGPRFVVVHDPHGLMSGNAEDDEDAYFVFDVGSVPRHGFEMQATVADALGDDSMPPATVLGPHDLEFALEAGTVDIRRAPVVLVQDGLVQGLVEPPPALAASAEVAERGFVPEALADEAVVAGDFEVVGGGGPAADAGAVTAMGVSVDYPKSVPVNETISLLVALTADPGEPDVIPVAVAQEDVIDVIVSAKSGFVIEGPAEVKLRVSADPGDLLPGRIRLRATEVGRGEIVVYAFLGATALGSLTVTPEVVEAGAEPAPSVSALTTLEVRRGGDADLLFIIFEQRDAAGRTELIFRLKAADHALKLNMKTFGPVRIETSPAQFFANLYSEINDLRVDTANLRKLAAERLTAIGSSLFTQLLPEDLQVLLWGLRDRIRTVFVQSEEPWVPWELCRLQGVENGRVVEGQFFCEAFEMTRWILEIPLVTDLQLRDLAVIAPPSDLTFAKQEVAMLLALAGPSRSVQEVKPPTYTKVREALGVGVHDGIHFVGHGRYPENGDPSRAEISLAGTQTLKPTDISGVVKNLGIPKPLVFLNACEVGRQGLDLTGVGGWANALLHAGAGALVASHWNVSDHLAVAFSTAFYKAVLAGETVAGATRAARLSIRDEGDPTWLAYTAFADPGVRLTA